MKWYHFFILFAQGFILAWLLTPLMRRIAPQIGFLDQPGYRKVHYQPKPLLGGAAIFLAFMISLLGDLLILRWIHGLELSPTNWFTSHISYLAYFASGVEQVTSELVGLLVGGTLLFVVGLIDDRYDISPLLKLIAQIIASIILYFADIQIALFIEQPLINFCLTTFWIILITNSFNFLDNMDGLSGGVAMICLILLGISTYIVNQQSFMSAISFVLAGSIAGFLRFNLNPSSIFMGDAGSLTLGFFVSALTVLSTFYQEGTTNATSWSVVMPVVILAVPIFDTMSVIFIRIKNGNPIYVGDKNHFSHRLVALGMSHRRAVFFIHLTTLCVGSSALILPLVQPAGAYIIFSQTILFFVLIAMLEVIKQKTNHQNHNSQE